MASKRLTPTKRSAAGKAKKRTGRTAQAARAKPNRVKGNGVKPVSNRPPPLAEDEIELSGIFGRVRYRESDPFAEVREIYQHYDRDKDGVISPAEFARILDALGIELEEHELRMALRDVDRNGDAKIGWDEFLGWWQSMRG